MKAMILSVGRAGVSSLIARDGGVVGGRGNALPGKMRDLVTIRYMILIYLIPLVEQTVPNMIPPEAHVALYFARISLRIVVPLLMLLYLAAMI